MEDKYQNYKDEIEKINQRVKEYLEKNDLYSKLKLINTKMLDANFWHDKNKSKNIIKEKKLYEDLINSYNDTIKKLKDLDDLNELASEENNQIVYKEILQI